MIAALAILLAASTAAAPEEEFRAPSNAMVAFNDGCDWALTSLDALPEDLAERGWRRFEPQRGSRLAAYLAADPQAPLRDPILFQGEAGGRTVFLALREDRESPGRIRRSCTLLDFDAPEPIALAHLVPWAGRHPTGDVGGHGEPRRGYAWLPGLSEGHDRTEIYFVPADSPLVAGAQLKGMVFTTVRSEAEAQ